VAIGVREVRAIGEQAATLGKGARAVDGRHPLSQRKARDVSDTSEGQRGQEHEQPIRALAREPVERSVEIRRVPELEGAEHQSQGSCRMLGGLPVAGWRRERGLPEHGDPGHRRHSLLQQRQPLTGDLRGDIDGQAGDVAPGAGQARDEPCAHRIRGERHDDRDGGRRSSGEGDRVVTPRHDGIDVQLDKLRHQGRQSVDLAVGESVIEPDVPPFDVAESLETVFERSQEVGVLLSGAGRDMAETVDLREWLRLERRAR
jgi:hypothetical protein